MPMTACGTAGRSANKSMHVISRSDLNVAPLTGTGVVDHIGIITGAFGAPDCMTCYQNGIPSFTDSFEDRQD